MIKVFHAARTRSFRVLWMLEEMGLAYEVETVPFPPTGHAGLLAVNPLMTLPAVVDGDTVMTESVAVLEYLGRRYGPTPLTPAVESPDYARYLEFLLFGEASLGAYLSNLVRARFFAPEADKRNWTVLRIEAFIAERAAFLGEQLKSRPYMAGDVFTAADISVGYSLGLAHMLRLTETFPEPVKAYLKTVNNRPAHLRARER
jgi:glutathione S-transferase